MQRVGSMLVPRALVQVVPPITYATCPSGGGCWGRRLPRVKSFEVTAVCRVTVSEPHRRSRFVGEVEALVARDHLARVLHEIQQRDHLLPEREVPEPVALDVHVASDTEELEGVGE